MPGRLLRAPHGQSRCRAHARGEARPGALRTRTPPHRFRRL